MTGDRGSAITRDRFGVANTTFRSGTTRGQERKWPSADVCESFGCSLTFAGESETRLIRLSRQTVPRADSRDMIQQSQVADEFEVVVVHDQVTGELSQRRQRRLRLHTRWVGLRQPRCRRMKGGGVGGLYQDERRSAKIGRRCALERHKELHGRRLRIGG